MTLLFLVVGVLALLLGWTAFTGAPYVPSQARDIDDLFSGNSGALSITAADILLDLGSGDGIVLAAAAKRGAKAIGYEIHPLFLLITRHRLRHFSRDQVRVTLANMWRAPFPPDVTIVYAFSVGRDTKRLARKLQREADTLGHGFTFVCYGNPLPPAAQTGTAQSDARHHGAYSIYHFTPLHAPKA